VEGSRALPDPLHRLRGGKPKRPAEPSRRSRPGAPRRGRGVTLDRALQYLTSPRGRRCPRALGRAAARRTRVGAGSSV